MAPSASRRGSRAGELVARCVVEIGTSAYYTALREAAQEPVLQEICRHIAADELRHYRLFYKHLDRVLADRSELVVTRQNHEPVVILPLAELEGLRETLHLLSTPANAEHIRASVAELDAGKGRERALTEK